MSVIWNHLAIPHFIFDVGRRSSIHQRSFGIPCMVTTFWLNSIFDTLSYFLLNLVLNEAQYSQFQRASMSGFVSRFWRRVSCFAGLIPTSKIQVQLSATTGLFTLFLFDNPSPFWTYVSRRQSARFSFVVVFRCAATVTINVDAIGGYILKS